MSNGSMTTCTYTLEKSVPSNALFTDTNTWRPVQNNLTSTSTSDCLSAYQGKWLNDNKVSSAVPNTDYFKVDRLNTFKGSDNALIAGGKGNYIWAISSFSDSRLKKNIKDTNIKALDIINKIKMHEFDFKDNNYGKHQDIGYIAQELKEIIPEAVVLVPASEKEQKEYNTETLMMVEDKHIIKYLVKAVQELTEEIEKLKK